MREIEVNTPPTLDPSRERTTDLHSLMNILNIISLHMGELDFDFQHHKQSFAALAETMTDLARDFQYEDDISPLIIKLRQTEFDVMHQLQCLSLAISDETEKAQIAAAIENAESIYAILNVRLDELVYRLENPDISVDIHKEDLSCQMQDVLNAIEKNANGRYYIRYNLALKQEGDYYIDLKVESSDKDGVLKMPLRFKDVMRDLLANARKYTKPGGKVALAVYQSQDGIECLIEDNGCGIPEDELEKVSEFGYRATNVRSRRTMGGGFGLTKAVWLVHRWGGSFRIASAENAGTRIRITVPNQAGEAN